MLTLYMISKSIIEELQLSSKFHWAFGDRNYSVLRVPEIKWVWCGHEVKWFKEVQRRFCIKFSDAKQRAQELILEDLGQSIPKLLSVVGVREKAMRRIV